jgi:hypothetical protein
VHSGFVDLRTVPSVIGLSIGEAKGRLAALGLEVRLAPGTPAPSPNAEGTVQAQSPDGGASIDADSVVTLTVHSPWVPPPTAVPLPTRVPPTPVPPPPTNTPVPPPPAGGRCHIQEFPGRGAVNILFRQQAPGGQVIVYVYSIPPNAEAAIRQQMTGLGLALAGRYSSYQAAMNAAHSICASVTGGGPPPPPTPAGPPQCPGPNAPAIFTLFDPPPYAGRSTVCRDNSGKLWINVSNNVRPVTSIQQGAKDPNSECWWGTKVVTPAHTYEGTLCR